MSRELRPERPERRWYQYSLLQLVLAVTALSLLLSCFAWYRAWVEPWEIEDQIRATIASLAEKRPPTMTREQWASAVEWTEKLGGNSLLHSEANVDELRRYQRELKERTAGKVDMMTILWIWDQHARLTRAGKNYQRFRQQMLDEIASVGPNDDPWALNVP
jgi:hypothetical protein